MGCKFEPLRNQANKIFDQVKNLEIAKWKNVLKEECS